MTTPELETTRLVLRPVQLSDAEQVQPLFAQMDVVRLLNARIPWPFPKDGVRTYYAEYALPGMARGEEWHWTMRQKSEPGRIIGAISLHLHLDTHRGFWLAPSWRRQGLMTEAVAAVTRFWFQDLKQPLLRVRKARENTASRAISINEGMRCVGETVEEYVSGRLPTELWEIDATTWRQRHQNL